MVECEEVDILSERHSPGYVNFAPVCSRSTDREELRLADLAEGPRELLVHVALLVLDVEAADGHRLQLVNVDLLQALVDDHLHAEAGVLRAEVQVAVAHLQSIVEVGVAVELGRRLGHADRPADDDVVALRQHLEVTAAAHLADLLKVAVVEADSRPAANGHRLKGLHLVGGHVTGLIGMCFSLTMVVSSYPFFSYFGLMGMCFSLMYVSSYPFFGTTGATGKP
ncbi:hypothetical protein TYRP_003457 [Tyrophagus putrescentiae]|nr:hypothetical protein TYRP_003457 [Tyrophagus putrescentiae]